MDDQHIPNNTKNISSLAVLLHSPTRSMMVEIFDVNDVH